MCVECAAFDAHMTATMFNKKWNIALLTSLETRVEASPSQARIIINAAWHLMPLEQINLLTVHLDAIFLVWKVLNNLSDFQDPDYKRVKERILFLIWKKKKLPNRKVIMKRDGFIA